VSDPMQDVISSSKAPAPYVGITTCSIPLTKMETIRKRAIAVGGGALVGTGAVLMVTPLHPIGHAMAIGGLGVLGTEFEGPKKAFQKARQSAASLAAKMKKPPVATPAVAATPNAKAAKEVSKSFTSSSSAAAVTKPSSKSMSSTNE
jgi:hypothetical protein